MKNIIIMLLFIISSSQLFPQIENSESKSTRDSVVSYPLLPMIFFDFNSYNLDSLKYVILNKELTNYYNSNITNYTNALQYYYDILNIIGKKLNDNQGLHIIITGFVDSKESKENEIAKMRALTVKNYLIEIWQIQNERISCQFLQCPVNEDRTDNDFRTEEEINAELRRVELNIF